MANNDIFGLRKKESDSAKGNDAPVKDKTMDPFGLKGIEAAKKEEE